MEQPAGTDALAPTDPRLPDHESGTGGSGTSLAGWTCRRQHGHQGQWSTQAATSPSIQIPPPRPAPQRAPSSGSKSRLRPQRGPDPITPNTDTGFATGDKVIVGRRAGQHRRQHTRGRQRVWTITVIGRRNFTLKGVTATATINSGGRGKVWTTFTW